MQPNSNTMVGRNRTIRGFSLLEIIIVMGIAIVMLTVVTSGNNSKYHRRRITECENNLENIFVALQTYSAANTDSFPYILNAKTSESALGGLVPQYTTTASQFICPGCRDKALPDAESFKNRKISYAYYMGHKTSDSPDQPLMSDRQVDTNPKQIGQLLFSPDGKKPGNNHSKYGGNILFCDGSVKSSPAQSSFVLTNGPGVVLLNPKP